ncbi:hypothetical protein SAMN06269250_3844 [Spirosoma fluviale]|uniref:Uncharacterized protein n=1 Tax=Spirosoma fluviale TaxID=1597977 RepID=A0A286G9M3_9BACT|nr:hypothetical protein SAMN06269250_3844 [Spirosoma fluviale]
MDKDLLYDTLILEQVFEQRRRDGWCWTDNVKSQSHNSLGQMNAYPD